MANKSKWFFFFFFKFGWQWLFGFVLFLVPGASMSLKSRMLPWHMFWGRLLLYMAICAALTGLMEKTSFLRLQHHNENRLMNFTGLSILLFGIFVDLSSVLAHYVWFPFLFIYHYIYVFVCFIITGGVLSSLWNSKLLNCFVPGGLI